MSVEKNLDAIFNPKNVAIIGASRNPGKIGHAITKNFLDSGFSGGIFPVNPNAEEIIGLPCYSSVLKVDGDVDSAVISVPSSIAAQALKECGKKGVRGVVLITGGFSEVGNTKGEEEIKRIAEDYGIALIGPNCLGVLNPASRVDSIFLPIYKMGRPRVGDIAFISQSGAVGGCIIDLAARDGIGISKFVSYGNASVIDETHLLEYLAKDKQTRIIVCYLEGARRGREFLEAAKRTTLNKPVIAIKAGVSKRGAEATASHTGSLAGSAQAYKAVFKQAKVIEATTLMELFYFAKAFDQPLPKGKRVAVITNGGGYGVLSADAVEAFGLELAEFSEETKKILKKNLPPYANAKNPLDIIGDADSYRYEVALNAALNDPNVDIIAVVTLFQTVGLDSRVVNVIVRASDERKKPILVIATGGEFTDTHRRILDNYGVPTYHSPTAAMKSAAKIAYYSEFLEKKKVVK